MKLFSTILWLDWSFKLNEIIEDPSSKIPSYLYQYLRSKFNIEPNSNSSESWLGLRICHTCVLILMYWKQMYYNLSWNSGHATFNIYLRSIVKFSEVLRSCKFVQLLNWLPMLKLWIMLIKILNWLQFKKFKIFRQYILIFLS